MQMGLEGPWHSLGFKMEVFTWRKPELGCLNESNMYVLYSAPNRRAVTWGGALKRSAEASSNAVAVH